MNDTNQKPECCPKFDPAPWDGKIVEWKDKLFIKDKVFSLFYMPINFGQVITRMMKKVEAAGAKLSDDWLCLSDHTSKWNMDLYVAVNKEIKDIENVKSSGKFLFKVYEGNYKETGKWCKDFERYAQEKNLEIQKILISICFE